MTGQKSHTRDADIDIGQLFVAVWQNKLRIILGAFLFTVLMFVILSFVSPKYKASTKVLINDAETVFTRPTGGNNQAADQSVIDRENVQSQVQILTSTDLLLKVAEQEKLGDYEEFDSQKEVSSLKMGLILLGLVKNPSEMAPEQRVLKAMRERLKVFAVETSRVIVIEFRSKDPELAARIPKALAKAYVSMESQQQKQNTGEAAQYLAREITQLQSNVRRAEANVADFRAATGLFASGANNSTTLPSQQLTELSTELSRVRAERSNIESRVKAVRAALESGAALDTLPDVISSPLIERLSEQQVQLNGQIADLSTTLLPGHPRIKALRSQLDTLDTQIRDQAERVLQGLRNRADISRSREEELNQDLNELKAASSQAGSEEVELRALEREAASQRALLESYLIRFREAQARGEQDYAPAKARIISSDRTPIEPYFPKMIPILAVSFFGAVLLMMLITLMRELLSGRAMIPADNNSNYDLAAQKTEITDMPRNQTKNDTDSAVTAAIESINVNKSDDQDNSNDDFSIVTVAQQLAERGAGRAIMLSPEGDAGSICSVNLARYMVDQGIRVVLVDLTGTGASSQHMQTDPDLPGITDLLAAEASYAEVIHNDAATRAHLIPIGMADINTAMRAIDRLPIIMNALTAAYDIIIIDCGQTDATALKRLVSDDSEIIIAIVKPDSQEVIHAAEDLVADGHNDVLIVTADALDSPLPSSNDFREAAY